MIDGASVVAILRRTRNSRPGLLAFIGRVERESLKVLAGEDPDHSPTGDDDLVRLYLARHCLSPKVAAHVELLRACLAVRESTLVAESIFDWLVHAVAATHPERFIGAQHRQAQRTRASGPRKGALAADLRAFREAHYIENGSYHGWVKDAARQFEVSRSTVRRRLPEKDPS